MTDCSAVGNDIFIVSNMTVEQKCVLLAILYVQWLWLIEIRQIL